MSLFYIYFGGKGYSILRRFPPPHSECKCWTFIVGDLISATHWAHLTISTSWGSSTSLATANGKDKIRQTFPIPTCLSSSSIFPESLQTLQLSLSSFRCDRMKSLTLHKRLLLVLDIPESQVYSCKTLQIFLPHLLYFFHNISVSPGSSWDFYFNSFLIIYINFQFCPLNHGACRIFFFFFFFLHCRDSLWSPEPAFLPLFLTSLIPAYITTSLYLCLFHSKMMLLPACPAPWFKSKLHEHNARRSLALGSWLLSSTWEVS